MTPRQRSSSESWRMRLYAPRSLKLNTGVRSSRLKYTCDPRRADSCRHTADENSQNQRMLEIAW